MEIWKPIVGYEGLYEVSSEGRIKSCKKTVIRNKQGSITFPEKIMKTPLSLKGYQMIDLRNNGIRKRKSVHRLVAKAFINNTDDKETVNHKDGNKTNNTVENLEWMTNQENMRHAYDTGLATNKNASEARRRKVVKIDKQGNEIAIYSSLKNAKESTGISNISAVCRGIRPFAGGYYWMYYEQLYPINLTKTIENGEKLL